MKVKVCDVCYYERDGKPMPRDGVKITRSKWRLRYRSSKGERISLDACDEHQDYFKTCKSYAEAQAKVAKLYGGAEMKTYVFHAWIHPKRGGDDHRELIGIKSSSEELATDALKKLLRRKSAVVDDFKLIEVRK